jgi:hypothetical protein
MIGLISWASWPISIAIGYQPELGEVEIAYDGADTLLSATQRCELREALTRAIQYSAQQQLIQYRRAFGRDHPTMPPLPQLLQRVNVRISGTYVS